MPCTARYSRGNKILPAVFSKKKGTTFIELIFSLLIFSMMLIPTGFAIQFMVQTGKEMEEPLFLTHIRNHMMQVSAESLASYEEGEVIYRKGDHLHGYVFQGNLILGFTHYGQIKKGASVLLTKNKERYRLTVRPVSGLVSLKKE